MGRTLTTVEKHGQRIKHKTVGTEAEIIGTSQIGYAGELLQGFRVRCLGDGTERFLPFRIVEQYELV